MKKIFSVLLIIMILAFSLTSCGERDKTDISEAKSLKDLNGSVIAAQTGTFHLDALREQTEGVTVLEYPDFGELLVALQSQTIDGYVAEEPTAFDIIAKKDGLDYLPFINNETGFTASDSDTGIAVAYRTGSPLVDATNAVIDTISQDVRSALMEQMVRISISPDTPIDEEIILNSAKTDTSKGTLRIAMECAYAPFNWSQTTNANGAVRIANSPAELYVNGYDVQVAKYIAAELGYALEIYEAEWDSLIVGVQAGTFDGIIAGMSPTAEREEEVDFTHCYYNSNLVIIILKSAEESSFFENVINIVNNYSHLLISGIEYTLLISLIGTVIGLLIGLLTGIIRTIPTSKNRWIALLQKAVNALISVYVEVFRGTPMMVQSMVIFWGYAFMMGGKTLPLVPAGIFIVSINTGAYMAEIVRGGIISIDKGQFEGATACGMTHWQTMTHVVIPQVMKNILPSISNEFVINIKDTSVLNVIGVMELYSMAGKVQAMTFKMFETYLIVCVIYFILTFTITRILRLIEKLLSGKDSYTICGSQSNPAAEIHINGKEAR